jgi:HSP20 family protein
MTAWFKKVFSSEDDDDGEAGLVASDEAGGEGEEGQLTVDVYQDKDNVFIKSTIAGVKPEDLDITLSGESVTIRGDRKQEEAIKDEDYFYQECYWGAFSRSLNLPVEIDVDRATADLKDGILTLVLPKASRARTKKVRVKTEV